MKFPDNSGLENRVWYGDANIDTSKVISLALFVNLRLMPSSYLKVRIAREYRGLNSQNAYRML